MPAHFGSAQQLPDSVVKSPLRSRTARLISATVVAGGLILVPTPMAGAAPAPPSASFGCANAAEATYTVPAGVDRLFVSIGGGLGAADSFGDGTGGAGARIDGTILVSAGQSLAIKVGCGAIGRTGGKGWSKGGNGGDASVFGDGGGGGGSTGVSLVTGSAPTARSPRLVASGGGGVGGGTSFEGTQNGTSGNDVPYAGTGGGDGYNGANGWGSVGGAGGGAGGGGWKGGNGGRGGSTYQDNGGRGWGGSSYASAEVQGAKFTVGGAPRSDGYAQLIPIVTGRPVPSVTVVGCNAGRTATYTVPARVYRLTATVVGAGGAQVPNVTSGGYGASVQGTIDVTPGQTLNAVVGCAGGGSGGDSNKAVAGVGYGKGGAGGHNSAAENGGDSGGGGGGASALLSGTTPLIVAGGGGGGGGQSGGLSSSAGGRGGDGSRTGQSGGSASGAGGAGGTAGGSAGTAGSNSPCAGAGGGGGGGFRGGRGGNSGSCSRAGGGGGGGSSFLDTRVGDVTVVPGTQARNGVIVFAATASGVPGAPTAVAATAGDGQATVTFTPGDDGGATVGQYRVTASPGGATAIGPAGPITVPGLINGTPYRFTVSATNAVGTSAPSTPSNAVVPAARPGAPTGVSATPGNQQATVSFIAPANTGGAAISSYQVTATPGGVTATGSGSPITVTGLTNGTSTTFTVTATNPAGAGPASAPSNAVTPATLPSPPLLVTAEPRDGKAVVSFRPPLSDGGSAVTSYTVTAAPGGATASGASSPITVPGLTNGTAYTVTVTATNPVGTSQPSPVSNPVTPRADSIGGPPNDDFANAQAITGTAGSVTGSNVGATLEAGEREHDPNQPSGASVWYRFDVPVGGGAVQFDLCGSTMDGVFGVYRGDRLDTLTNVGPGRPRVNCLDGTSAPAAVFDLNIDGGTFWIAVAGADTGSGPSTGDVQLRWAPSTAGGG